MELASFPVSPNLRAVRINYNIKVTGYSCTRRAKCIGKSIYLSSLTKNLEYTEREQHDSGGGGALSQGAGHGGSFFR